jgi:pyruvate/2-oxoglutarate dehydrogenase complex dihydrolipoamide acyltransferase (E2) component
MQMKTVLRISVIVTVLGFMVMADIPQLPVQLVPDAEAIFGVRRRAFRRGVILGAAAEGTAGAAAMYSATAQQQSATAQQEAATAQQQSATAQQQSMAAHQPEATPPPPPGGDGKPLPIGTVVHALPGGCTATPVAGVDYYYCAGNFYRAVFQGNQLVYVTAKP